MPCWRLDEIRRAGDALPLDVGVGADDARTSGGLLLRQRRRGGGQRAASMISDVSFLVLRRVMYLILFDIDGTLVLTGRAGMRAMNRACEDLVSGEEPMAG